MNAAKTERKAITDLLAEVGPDRPTLCDGWTTHDLAAHLWIRENDLRALPGIGVSALSGLTQRRLDAAKVAYAYPELVRRLANPPIWTKPLSVVNGVEFFIHRMDILRANPDLPERQLSAVESDQLWPYAKLMARRLRKGNFGVVLERSDASESIRIAPGVETVTLIGTPGELVLLLSGRGKHADVEIVGTPEASKWVSEAQLGL